MTAAADQPFKIDFKNNDSGIPHNVAIDEGSPTGAEKFKGEIFPGPDERTLIDVPVLPAGAYAFVCVHGASEHDRNSLTVQCRCPAKQPAYTDAYARSVRRRLRLMSRTG